MAKIDLDEFREVLGVEYLYPDTVLQQVADAADALIDGLLDYNAWSITGYSVDNQNVATYYTAFGNSFNVGDNVTISGIGGVFNGAKTVTERSAAWFRVALTNAELEYQFVRPYGRAIVTGQIALYDNTPAIREASLAVAVEIFQQRVAPGGTIQSVDFTPTPHRLGRALLTRVTGLIAPYMNMGRFVG